MKNWKIGQQPNGIVFVANEEEATQIAELDTVGPELKARSVYESEVLANAKLIAAAPDLLSDFEYILHCLTVGDWKDADEDYIKAGLKSVAERAIRKATK